MRHSHPGGLLLTKRLLAYCALTPAAKVVDLGCGRGETIKYLQKMYGINAVGLDSAAERLNEAKTACPDLEFIEAAAENLPFAESSMDVVLAECSLSVMKDAGRVVAETSRVLVPGGKFAVSDIYAQTPDNKSPQIFFTYDTLEALLKEHGFKIVVWEDHAARLAEFAAGFIMEYGSVQKLWECVMPSQTFSCNSMKSNKPSYFLLLAEKII